MFFVIHSKWKHISSRHPAIQARRTSTEISNQSGIGNLDSESSLAGNESGVRSDSANSSSPFALCRRWWGCSTLRLLAEEICNVPRRIQTALAKSHLRFGYTLPLYPTFDSKESRGQGYVFLCACSEDIKKLHRDNPWTGCLDLELAGAAYQAGAQWAIRSFRKETTSMVSESLSCAQFSQVPWKIRAIQIQPLPTGPDPLTTAHSHLYN